MAMQAAFDSSLLFFSIKFHTMHLTTLGLWVTSVVSTGINSNSNSNGALRIMPVGDSITQWHCGSQARNPADPKSTASFGGFRGPLFQQLQAKWGENAFATVGGEYGCGSHEGHSGWTCEDLAGIITTSAVSYSPDVVLLMCGTNDLYYRPSTLKPEKGGNVTQVLDRMTMLLASLFAVRPNATVLLSTVPEINATKCLSYGAGPCPPSMPTNIAAVNAALPTAVVAPLVAAGRRVFLCDVNADAHWEEADFWTWGIHRSEEGFAKMAASFLQNILAHVVPPTHSPAAAKVAARS